MNELLLGGLSIVLIDLLLAGDNAVMIALAVRGLPPERRKLGIGLGAGVAVLLRVVLTFFAAQLLTVPYLRLGGGIMVLWIAVKLLADASDDPIAGERTNSMWQAVWLIFVADITMSVDNIIAVAAASKGDFRLMLFGLILSVPFIVFTSNLISTMMAKYPIIVYIGAGILGRVGGEMVMADFKPSHNVDIAVQVGATVAVLGVGYWMAKRKKNAKSA